MLDGQARKLIDPWINKIAVSLSSFGIKPNHITIAGFGVGLMAALLIIFGYFLLALPVLILSRIADGLDGAVARHTNAQSDFGGFLDITLDFAFYGAIPLAFILFDPAQNGAAGAILLLSFYFNGASFLAFAIMAEKNGITDSPRGKKSLFYTTGLAEASETIAVFCLLCLMPNYFNQIAYIFAAIVFYTTFSRIMLAKDSF